MSAAPVARGLPRGPSSGVTGRGLLRRSNSTSQDNSASISPTSLVSTSPIKLASPVTPAAVAPTTTTAPISRQPSARVTPGAPAAPAAPVVSATPPKPSASQAAAAAVAESKAAADAKTAALIANIPPPPTFQLDDFGADFQPDAFVEKCTEALLRYTKRTQLEFDPKILRNVFEQSNEQLRRLRTEANKQITSLVSFVRDSELEHRQKMSSHDGDLTAVMNDFKHLDRRIAKVATTAVRIGDNLEAVDLQRERCVRGRELIAHFLDFNSGDPARLAPIFSDPRKLHEAASVLQALQLVVQDLALKGVDQAIDAISQKSSEVETRLLEQFAIANSKERFDEMKQCARTLLGFQGSNIISRYVSETLQTLGRVPSSADQKLTVAEFRNQLNALLRDLIAICRREFRLIQQVFPEPERIIRSLLDRAFEDKIGSFLDTDLTAPGRSVNEYLQILECAYDCGTELVTTLDQLCKTDLNRQSSIYMAAASPTQGINLLNMKVDKSTVNINLGELVESIFGRYRHQFITNQVQYLEDFALHEINQTMYVLDAKELHERDFFCRRKTTARAELHRVLNTVLQESDLVDRVLQASAGALKRSDKLSDDSTAADFARRIFAAICDRLCEYYLAPVVELIADFLPDPEGDDQPEFSFLELAQGLNFAVQKIEMQFSRLVLPRMQAKPDEQSEATQQKRNSMSRIEEKIRSGVQRCLQAAVHFVAHSLKEHQHQSDYYPDADVGIPDEPTPACEIVSRFMQQHAEVAVKTLDGRNLDMYLTLFGAHVYAQLVASLKKHQISTVGALFLLRDCKEYQEVVRELHIPGVTESFETLRALTNLLIVAPEGLRTCVQKDTRLSKLKPVELNEFVRLRADFRDEFLQRYLA